MAILQIMTSGLDNQSIELKLGANRVGRSPHSDFQIVHPTISSRHCELILADDDVVVLRDLESTNGTFLNGQRVREAALAAGQTIRLGDVELLVENTDATVAIPEFWNVEISLPPTIVEKDGVPCCPRHEETVATHQCPICKELMCDACVHRLRRQGGRFTLLLCPICSNAVEPLGATPKKKRSLLSALMKLGR